MSASSSTSVPSNLPPVAVGFRRREEEREASDIIPLELWTEILVRLPVRSLLTLKLVSKAFFSLIKNPNFTSLHFSRFHNCYSQSKGSESDLLLLEREMTHSDLSFPLNEYSDFFLVHRSSTPRDSIEFRVHVHWGDHCYVVGNVNGLLLLRRYTSSSEDMILCNPLIGKRLVIPPSPSSHRGRTQLGFGYDPVTNDYKVVSIVYIKYEPLNPEPQDQVEASPCTLVEVYSLRAASWRTIGFDVVSRGWFLESYVYANGCLHWIAGLHEHYDYKYHLSHIVSFDLGTELFSYRELPDLGIDDDPFVEVNLFVMLFHGLPAVCCLFARHISVWVMRETDWNKECCVESVLDMFRYLLDEASRSRGATFFEDSNELMAAGNYGIVSCNIETQQFKLCDPNVTYVGKYVESLLWVESLPSLDLD